MKKPYMEFLTPTQLETYRKLLEPFTFVHEIESSKSPEALLPSIPNQHGPRGKLTVPLHCIRLPQPDRYCLDDIRIAIIKAPILNPAKLFYSHVTEGSFNYLDTIPRENFVDYPGRYWPAIQQTLKNQWQINRKSIDAVVKFLVELGINFQNCDDFEQIHLANLSKTALTMGDPNGKP